MFTLPIHGIEPEAAVREFAKFYPRVGFNAVHLVPSSLSLELAKLNIRRYSQPNWLVNGYRLGTGKKPNVVRFQLMDGTYDPEGICPVEVYQEGKYFQSDIKEPLRKMIVADRQTEHIMPNWEPYMYFFKGCFCPRCKEEFVKFSKLPAEAVDRAWPADIIKNYRDIWVRFRSWQHAEMLVTLEKTIHTLGKEAGIESHFIPSIAFAELLSAGENVQEGWRQVSCLDYADKLPILEPWGPYIYDTLGKPYQYITGRHLDLHMSAVEVRHFVDDKIPAGKRPRLIGFTMLAPFYCFMQPEAVQFDFLTYLVDGWHGAFAYYFPEGYDARYWKVLAETNTLIAQFEPYVMTGKRTANHIIKSQTPLPEPDERSMDYYLLADKTLTKKWRKCPLLQSWEYQKDTQRLIAVANFWEKGECFFRLIPKELQSEQRYVLSEPAERRVYANDQGRIDLSSADLEKGILLHVGAIRYAFFVLDPYQEGKSYGRVILPGDMRVTLEKRIPEINAAYGLEKKLAASKPKVETADYSHLKTLQKAGLTCTPAPIETTGKTGLLFTSSHQQLLVDPSTGGRITSWKIKGDEYATRKTILV